MPEPKRNDNKRRTVAGLSLLEVSRRVGIPETTARRWAHRFAPYLGGRKGRAWNYPPEAVTVLQRIKERVGQGWESEEIERELQATFPATLEVELTTTTNQTPGLPVILARIADALERLERQGELERRVETLERARGSLPWWARLTRKKGKK